MKVTELKTTKIILELDEIEAEWLKNYVQNPLIENETIKDTEMREKLFNAIVQAR